MLKKLLIRTWRGPLPPWTPQFRESVRHLESHGWKFIIPEWHMVERACQEKLGVTIPHDVDTRKPGNYDPALGELFGEIIAANQCDFWGHFNLDCVYGRLSNFLPDAFLDNIDIYSNDPGTICGPFTIYRNTPKVNGLFRTHVPGQLGWRESFESPTFNGWDEIEFSKCVVQAALRGEVSFVSGFLQAHDHMTLEHQRFAQIPDARGITAPVRFEDDCLIDNVTHQEIMMYHFNQTRRWPLG